MVQMINGWTKTTMWVADDRVEEYKAAGHVLAVAPPVENPIEVTPEAPKKEEPKATPKKAAVKKKK